MNSVRSTGSGKRPVTSEGLNAVAAFQPEWGRSIAAAKQSATYGWEGDKRLASSTRLASARRQTDGGGEAACQSRDSS